MKKIIFGIVICAVAAAAIFGGIKLYLAASRPELNGNEKIVSTALEVDGTPKDVLGDATEITVSRDRGAVYLSIPVNSKDMATCHIKLIFGDQKLDDATISVSEARYATYCFDDLDNRESGLYQFEFYDSQKEINVIAAIELE